jgi:fucose permease
VPRDGRDAARAGRVKPFYRRSTIVFGLLSIGVGIALFVETAVQGGGSVGYALGVLFLALGIGRLYLVKRR